MDKADPPSRLATARPTSDPSEESPSLAVACVKALLERHGLPKYRQSAWLADAIGLSYAQAHRRMNGAASWTLEDLQHVAGLFGESLSELVSLGQAERSVPAILRAGATNLQCQLWIGEPVERAHPDTVVAIRTENGWVALCAAEATDHATYAVERLQAKPNSVDRKTVAVLDDDEDLTNSICTHLRGSGYETRAFYKTADLQSTLKAQRYDAFVIDWIVGESSTAKLIAALRVQDAACPIVVLTAQVLTGVVQESEIAAAVANFNLVFSEKPVRMAILSASLTRAFASK